LEIDENVLVFNSWQHAELVGALTTQKGTVICVAKSILEGLRYKQSEDGTNRKWRGATEVFNSTLDFVGVRCKATVARLRNSWNTGAASKRWSDVATRKARATARLVFVKKA